MPLCINNTSYKIYIAIYLCTHGIQSLWFLLLYTGVPDTRVVYSYTNIVNTSSLLVVRMVVLAVGPCCENDGEHEQRNGKRADDGVDDAISNLIFVGDGRDEVPVSEPDKAPVDTADKDDSKTDVVDNLFPLCAEYNGAHSVFGSLCHC